MAYRPLLQISGLLLLVYAILVSTSSLLVGGIALGAAVFLITAANWYPALLALAKFGAWLGTVRGD